MRDPTNSQDHDPLENALNWGRIICGLGDKETQTFLHYDHGDRNFPVAFSIAIWVKIAFAVYFLPRVFPSDFGAAGMHYYAAGYFIAFNVHRIHRLTRKEDELPDSRYDGTPWMLNNLIPQREFSKKEWPAWFPEDMEIIIKLAIEPVALFVLGSVLYDSIGDRALGAYLMFNALCVFTSKMITRSKDMDKYYDARDINNLQRYCRQKAQGKNPKNKGFTSAANFHKIQESIKIPQLSEDALNAKIEDLSLKSIKTVKSQPQAPPAGANEEDLAIGKKNLSSPVTTAPRTTPQSAPIEEEDDSDIPDTEDGITVFPDPRTTEPSQSAPVMPATRIPSNGAAKATAKVIKPPQSKIYKDR